jgi:hypothetical protein
MISGAIAILIHVAVVALVIYLVLWVVEAVAKPLPAKIVQIIWIVFLLWVVLQLLPLLGVSV